MGPGYSFYRSKFSLVLKSAQPKNQSTPPVTFGVPIPTLAPSIQFPISGSGGGGTLRFAALRSARSLLAGAVAAAAHTASPPSQHRAPSLRLLPASPAPHNGPDAATHEPRPPARVPSPASPSSSLQELRSLALTGLQEKSSSWATAGTAPPGHLALEGGATAAGTRFPDAAPELRRSSPDALTRLPEKVSLLNFSSACRL